MEDAGLENQAGEASLGRLNVPKNNTLPTMIHRRRNQKISKSLEGSESNVFFQRSVPKESIIKERIKIKV